MQRFLPVTSVVFMLAALALLCPGASGAGPNVIVLLADDMADYAMGDLDGDGTSDTPHLDSLASGGVQFRNAYNMGAWVGAVCTPSRHMIMTGRTVWHIPGAPGGNAVPADGANTIPTAFNAAGYETFVTSKNGNTYKKANDEFTFQGYRAVDRGATGPKAYVDSTIAYLDAKINATTFSGESTTTADPYLAYVAFANPHDPRVAPQDLLDKYGAKLGSPPHAVDPNAPPLPANYLPHHPFDNGALDIRDEDSVQGILHRRDEGTVRNELGKQYAVIDYMDQQIGRILEKAEAVEDAQAPGGDDGDDVLTNTIVLFTSDHGMAVGSHGLQGKQNLYEHTLGVPMLVAGAIDGTAVAQGESEANVYLLDVFPTIAELAGVTAPAAVEGQSFAAAVRGEQFAGRQQVYNTYTGGAAEQRSIRIGDWKMIHYSDINRTQLFNIADNPGELYDQDLSHDVANYDKLMELKAALEQEMADLQDPGALGRVGINVAFGKTAAQSSDASGDTAADRAVNGAGAVQGIVANGASPLPPEYAQTAAETDPWWQVDLGELFDIAHLTLYGNGSAAFGDLTVDILDDAHTPIYTSSLLNPGGGATQIDLALWEVETGQYVRVTRQTDSGFLSLEELQAFAVTDSYVPPEPPVPGPVTEWDSLPNGEMVILSQTRGGNNVAADRDTDGNYRKGGQTFQLAEAAAVASLTVQVNEGTALPEAGTHELLVWFGRWNANGTPGDTVLQETFDVAGDTFTAGKFYKFTFDSAFDLDAATDYAFQIWWTSGGADHFIRWNRANGNGALAGGGMLFANVAASDTSFPFSDGATAGADDWVFALETVPEPATLGLLAVGATGLLIRRRRS